MSRPARSVPDRVIPGLLAALVVANIALLILLETGGPLIGLVFYLVLLSLSLRARQRYHRLLMVGGLVGLGVHLVEVLTIGWSDYPGLMALNLALPAALGLLAWVAHQVQSQTTPDR